MGISREYEAPNDNLFVDHNHETEHIGDINMIQGKLAERKYPDIESEDERMMKWMDNVDYSRNFRIILDEELDANLNFWEDFKNPKFRESLMKRIEEKLYAGEIVDKKKPDDDTMVLSS